MNRRRRRRRTKKTRSRKGKTITKRRKTIPTREECYKNHRKHEKIPVNTESELATNTAFNQRARVNK